MFITAKKLLMAANNTTPMYKLDRLEIDQISRYLDDVKKLNVDAYRKILVNLAVLVEERFDTSIIRPVYPMGLGLWEIRTSHNFIHYTIFGEATKAVSNLPSEIKCLEGYHTADTVLETDGYKEILRNLQQNRTGTLLKPIKLRRPPENRI